MHIILSIREEFGRWELDSLIKSRDVRDITRVGESYFPSFHQSGRGGGGGGRRCGSKLLSGILGAIFAGSFLNFGNNVGEPTQNRHRGDSDSNTDGKHLKPLCSNCKRWPVVKLRALSPRNAFPLSRIIQRPKYADALLTYEMIPRKAYPFIDALIIRAGGII